MIFLKKKSEVKSQISISQQNDIATDVDQLGFTEHVSVIAQRIVNATNEDTPMTIGVYGEWGSGKSSFLKMVEKVLIQKEHDIYPIWFNAWKYGQEENLWVALIQKVISDYKISGGIITRALVRYKLWKKDINLKQGFYHLVWNLIKGPIRILFSLSIIIMAITLWPEIANEKISKWLAGLSLLNFGAEGENWITTAPRILTIVFGFWLVGPDKIIKNLNKNLGLDFSKMKKKKTYQEHINFIDLFSKDLEELVGIISQGKPLVVIIDDLDRCSPERIVELLDAMKLFFEAKKCIFLLAIDRDLVERVVYKKYKDLYADRAHNEDLYTSFGQEYFEKIIQLPVRVPLVNGEMIKQFILKLYPENQLIQETFEIFAIGLPNTPRKIKITLQIFLFICELAKKKFNEGVIVFPLIAKLVVIQYRYRTLYDDLLIMPSLLKDLEIFYERLEKAEKDGEEGIEPQAPNQNIFKKIKLYSNYSGLREILMHHCNENDTFLGTNVVEYLYLVQEVESSTESIPKREPYDKKQEKSYEHANSDNSVQKVDTGLFILPHSRQPFLRHVKNQISTIKAKIEQKQQIGIVGMGGIGKTALAIEFAYRFAEDYPGGVFWLSMESNLSGAAPAFLKAAEERGIIQPGWEEMDENDQIHLLLSQLKSDRKKLIILDNLESHLIPEEIILTKNSHLIVTTRNLTIPIDQVTLDLPDLETAVDIFIGYAKLEKSKINQQELDNIYEICKRVEYLPIALEILGSLSRGYPLKKMVSNLTKELISKERPTSNNELTSILASIDLAGYQFTIPRTKEVLCSMAYLDPETIAPELLADIFTISEDSIFEILTNLVDISILKKTEVGYRLHRLVQQAISFIDSDLKLGKKVLKHIRDKINGVMETGHYKDGYGLIPHIIHMGIIPVDTQAIDEFPNVSILSIWVKYLVKAGRYNSAELIAKNCYQRSTQDEEQNPAIVLSTMNNLALIYLSQGKYKEAEPLYEKALELSEIELGSDTPDAASTMGNLAELYRAQGKYEEAEPLYRRALKITETVLGPDHPDVAATLNNLAGLYRFLGKYEEAEPLYQRALKIRETVLGPDHPDAASTMGNLAELYRTQGKYEEAEPLYRRALKITETVLGPDHPDVAATLNNLAGLYRFLGKYEEAEPLYQRALKIRETVLGPDHPDVAATLNNLAGLYRFLGKYEEAEPLYQRALKIRETVLGPDHPDVAATLNNLAGLYRFLGKYEEAEPLYQRALKIRETVLGPDHPDAASTMGNLAELYRTQGKYEEAEPLYRRALKITETVLGPDHPDVAATLNNLARLYESQGKYDQAESLYQRALKISESVLGPDHPNTIIIRKNYEKLKNEIPESGDDKGKKQKRGRKDV